MQLNQRFYKRKTKKNAHQKEREEGWLPKTRLKKSTTACRYADSEVTRIIVMRRRNRAFRRHLRTLLRMSAVSLFITGVVAVAVAVAVGTQRRTYRAVISVSTVRRQTSDFTSARILPRYRRS